VTETKTPEGFLETLRVFLFVKDVANEVRACYNRCEYGQRIESS